MSALHIIKLDVENILKIKAVQADLQGQDVVPVVGANGAGKSSLLKAIEMAVGGKGVFPDQPLREGAKKGRISIDVGEYKIERSVTEGGSYLTLTTAEGVPVKEPQRVLDTLVGDCADPMAFLNWKPADQRAALMRIAGLDFTKADELLASTLEQRTRVGRDVKNLEARVQAARGVWPADLPGEEVSVAELARELEATRARENARRMAGQNVARAKARVEDALRELDHARATLADCEKELANTPIAGQADVDRVRERLEGAETTNKAIRAKKAYEDLDKQLTDARAEHAEVENTIDQIKARKEKILRETKLPVEGLSVSDDGVLFNGVPLSQASQAEKIRVGVAVALASNPRFRVIIVRDGSLLDDRSRDLLEAACREHEAQLMLELVRSDDANGIFLVDGAQVAAPVS